MPINWKYAKDNDKYAQCYRLQELLRLEHNEKQWGYENNIISKQELDNYLKNTYEVKDEIIITEMLKLRKKIKNDITINTTLNDVI